METSDLLLTLIIIFIFVILNLINILGVGTQHIKDNWPLYRCNPIVIPFASIFGHDVGQNFSFCIQNIQQSYMNELLAPINYANKVAGNVMKGNVKSLNASRAETSKMRFNITNIGTEIQGVLLNMGISVQKLLLKINTIFGQLIGVMTVNLFSLLAIQRTANSGWENLKPILSACFLPSTLVKKANGKIVKIKNLKLGDVLKNGQIVHATMNLHNLDANNNYTEKLYSLSKGEGNQTILVSGSHLIFDKSINNFIFVKDFSDSIESSINSDKLICLITSDHTIPLGDYVFHDWEDNNGSRSKTI